MMFRYALLIFLTGCFPNRFFKKEYLTLSESTCVDGTILNIVQAGCKSFYWGTDPEGVTLKIRCTYAPEDNWWTRTSFYAIPHNYPLVYTYWALYCEDRYVKMYSVPTGILLENSSQ
jgi:hypothetical protein